MDQGEHIRKTTPVDVKNSGRMPAMHSFLDWIRRANRIIVAEKFIEINRDDGRYNPNINLQRGCVNYPLQTP